MPHAWPPAEAMAAGALPFGHAYMQAGAMPHNAWSRPPPGSLHMPSDSPTSELRGSSLYAASVCMMAVARSYVYSTFLANA